jgi:glycosyltransferase involved in cell wall biosynthesis
MTASRTDGQGFMKYLWLTWIDPTPERDGQRIYSGRLIDAVAAVGAEIDVLCFASDESPRRPGATEGRIRWWPVARGVRPGWASVFSPLPNVAYRCDTQEMRCAFQNLATQRAWDAVVLDGLYTGWALPLLERFQTVGGQCPQVVYISHNHEESTRAGLARNYRGNVLKRRLLRRDATKARRLERRLVEIADIVTAITPEDANRFLEQHPDKCMVVLSPGYAGRRIPRRTITPALPRRAVFVGSFDWFAKRMNLEEFLAVADPVFAAAGAELQIIGDGAPAFLDGLRRQVRATEIVGPVPAVEPYLAEARLAIVPERTGGGFKLKVLEYVFNRLPVAALEGSVAGTPLRAPDTLLSFATMEDLARGAVAVLDDLPLLNRLQEQAYAACVDRFDWRQRGEQFLAHMAAT